MINAVIQMCGDKRQLGNHSRILTISQLARAKAPKTLTKRAHVAAERI